MNYDGLNNTQFNSIPQLLRTEDTSGGDTGGGGGGSGGGGTPAPGTNGGRYGFKITIIPQIPSDIIKEIT